MTSNENLKVIVKFYTEALGGNVCVSCRGSLNEMILKLKRYHNMSNFELKNNAYYRLQKGDSRTINNNIITDQLAIEFLRINKERIKLFSKYPDNWEDMLTVENKEVKEDEVIELNEDQEAQKKHLMKYKFSELREKYPDVKAEFGGSKSSFIDRIITQKEDTND
ncbi:hypothetical protein [Zunongwangia atlantica]|uniref:Uncharacterized protein n=2 Tax=Zunongwangia TaxID=417127 RepID=A0A1Y1T300_9FLAO|nr:hypothetical protein [Zunongwangia atlantica]ORL45396.1 hypothetical protein IIF7_11258 [Zunongwangia atlantica 22II14-10F7]